ncbi:hypothetical protein CSKR_109016 [Clonorchis sinensis]|uniref:Uncharacterized protein n=1 Tax=Clonorchis sinensis TaxID=79923 RepID=A0A3R7CZZ8_CLOSI|nr:hypothetical protein CSKR_109016 [Clonorchis sinensis]
MLLARDGSVIITVLCVILSASRLPISRLGQPGSIPVLVFPSGGMAARHRNGVAENSSTAHDRFRPSWGSSGRRLETSKTGDSAGFQVSLSQNQIDMQMSVFIENILILWSRYTSNQSAFGPRNIEIIINLARTFLECTCTSVPQPIQCA